MYSEQSNWRKKFAGAFLLCLLGLSAPVLGVGLNVVKPRPGTRIAERLDVPEIGRVDWSDVLKLPSSRIGSTGCADAVRLCAVHLQAAKGSMRNPIFHFVSLSSERAVISLVRQMGDCLTSFGEDVTVVIASESNPSFDDCKNEDVTGHRTRFIHVNETSSEEVLSAIEASKRDSDVVLVAGIPLSHRSDVELLSLKSDGVVLLAPCGESITEAGSELVDSLIAFQAPVIGVVS